MASAHQHVKPKCPGETLAAQPLRTINSQRLGVAPRTRKSRTTLEMHVNQSFVPEL
jgi:hypothetical protein